MYYFLIIYSFFLIIRPQDYSQVQGTFPIMKFLFLFLFIGLFFIKEKKINYRTDLFLILFLLTGLISHFSHLYLGGVLAFFFTFAPVVLVYYIVENVLNSEQKILLYLKFISGFAAVLALHGILQFHNNGIGWTGQTFSEGGTRIRYVGIFSDPNDLSLFFNMVMPFLVYFYIKTDRWVFKLLNIVLLAGFLYAIYLTQSRGALIGVYAMMNYYIWKQYGLKRVVLLNVIVLPVLLGLKGRMADIDAKEESAYGRIEAWYEGFQMLKQYPLLGVGPGMFTDYNELTAHNSFVLALAETGLIGYYFWMGSLYLSFMDLNYNLSFSQDNEIKNNLDFFLQLSMVGFMTSAFFLSRTYVVILYILLGIIAARSKIVQKETISTDIENYPRKDFLRILGVMFGSIIFILVIYKFSL